MRVSVITDPIRGTVPIGRVIWLYGVVGALIYSALGFFVDLESERALRIYTIGGIAYTLYVTVATYACAATIKSPFWRLLTRASALITLALLPFLGYVSLSGVLSLTSLGGIE
jgi:tellurite resistance protein TehA-like permease